MIRGPFALFFLLTTGFAFADDGDIEGVGGSIKLLKGHKTIRMVSEDVRIKLPEGTVRATFVFRNEGPATSVKMGFPESGNNASTSSKTRTRFGYFRSYVDGQRFKVKREGNLARDMEGDYHTWWTKSLRFGKHQTRVVVNEYQGGFGGDTSNDAYFNYVLSTGASWKGKIGRARITVDVAGLGRVSGLTGGPEGYTRRNHKFSWDLRNLEPSADDDVYVRWWDGFKDIWVNGKAIAAHEDRFDVNAYRFDVNADKGNQPPRSNGREVFLPIRAAAAFLGCKLKVLSSRSVQIDGPIRRLGLTTGSRIMTSGPRKYMLHRRVWVVRNDWGASKMVELRPLVEALGGKSWWDKKGLHIKLPR
jgi:hypothetical protein